MDFHASFFVPIWLAVNGCREAIFPEVCVSPNPDASRVLRIACRGKRLGRLTCLECPSARGCVSLILIYRSVCGSACRRTLEKRQIELIIYLLKMPSYIEEFSAYSMPLPLRPARNRLSGRVGPASCRLRPAMRRKGTPCHRSCRSRCLLAGRSWCRHRW